MKLAFNVFLLCIIAGALANVSVTADDLYWTGGTTSISTLTNWIDGDGNNPTDLNNMDHNGWVNMDSGNTPIITAADYYPGWFNDLNIGHSNGGGAGKLEQTGGVTNVYNLLRVGDGAIDGNPVSSLSVTGGSLYDDWEIYVGQNGGYGSLSIDNASVACGPSPSSGGYGWTQIGRDGGNGTLTMTGASTLAVGEEFRAGWRGGTGNVNLSGTSQITARGFQNMGRNDDGRSGSVLNLTMTDSSKLVSTWNNMNFGSNGGTAIVSITGTNSSDKAGIGNVAPGADTDWIAFGVGDGSHATLTMIGNAEVNSGGYDMNLGCGGTANFIGTMTGDDNGRPLVIGGSVYVGKEGATATLTVTDATVSAGSELFVGHNGSSSSGELILYGDAQANATGGYGNINIGRDSGTGTVTMHDTSSMTCSGGGEKIVRVGIWGNGTGTLNMEDSATVTAAAARVGTENGTGTLHMTGGTFHTDYEFGLGWKVGTGTLWMDGSSKLEVRDLYNVGRDDGSFAYVDLLGSASVKTTGNGDDGALNFGSNRGYAEVTMKGDSSMKTNGTSWGSIGRDEGSSATLTMGTATGTDTASFSCKSWFNIGCWGGAEGTVTMYANTSMDVCTQEENANIGQGGTGTLVMHDSARFTSGGALTLGDSSGTGIVTLYDNAKLSAFGNVNINAGDSVVTLHDSATTMTAPSVQVGGTLKGNGTVVGDVVSVAGSTIEPGTSIGTLTVTGNLSLAGSLDIEYNQANTQKIDKLLVSGDLDLTGGILDFALETGGSALTDLAYVFATYGTRSGSLPTEQNVPAGYRVEYAYGGNSIALVEVPEPSTLVLLALGLLGIAVYRRRS
jgi:fibronectin-binding autotransporter adhesin